MKILAIDVGKKRIGLATCDRLEIAASPFCVVKAGKRAVAEVAGVIKKEAVEAVVVGLAVSFDGVERNACTLARYFKNELEKVVDVPIEFSDERFTSKIAEASLIDSGMRREQRRDVIDAVAASVILQGYLDSRRNKGIKP